MVGVAYRGNIALEDIKVDFQIEPIELPNAIGFGVKELVTLKGSISESERVRLERASRFCPVGQALTKGSIQFEDEVQWGSGEVTAITDSLGALPELDGALPILPTGSVHGRYLLDTKEYDADGGMVHEGEAKVYLTCDNTSRTSRWTLVGGHSSEGWVSPPFPMAQAGWAASTAATLTRLLPVGLEKPEDVRVELSMATPGGRGQAQSNAAAGTVAQRRALRRVVVPGTPRTTPVEIVQAALQRDPITIAYRNGGVLLEDRVVVE